MRQAALIFVAPCKRDACETARPGAVRYEMLCRLGYFVTKSSEHFAEYAPWFITADQPELIDHYAIPIDEYPRRRERQIAQWDSVSRRLTDPAVPLEVILSQD